MGARGGGEHNGEDLTTGDLAAGEIGPVNCRAPTLSHCLVGSFDPWDPAASRSGCMDWVHLAAGPDLKFVFVYLFSRFCSKLQKSIS